MSYTDNAAEQIVKMSLDGAEAAVRITGAAAKEIALMLIAALKKQGSTLKTKGKERLNTMLKSGKPLEIFSVKESDLRKFAQGAKQYGIVYCVLRSTKNSPDGLCDVLVKADDAPKISRVIERFKFATIDKARIESDLVQERAERGAEQHTGDSIFDEPHRQSWLNRDDTPDAPDRSDTDDLVNDLLGKPEGKTVQNEPKPPVPRPKDMEAPDTRPLASATPEASGDPFGSIFGRSGSSGKDIIHEPPDSGEPSVAENGLDDVFKRNELVFSSNETRGKGAMGRQSVKDEIREIKAERSAKEKDKTRKNDRAAPEIRKPGPGATHTQPQRGRKTNKKSKGAR